MKSFLTDFLYLFYPKRCIVCGDIVHSTVDLCEDCERGLKPITVKTCKKCGNPKKLCCCKRYVYHFRGISSPYLNEGSAQKAVYFYKFGGNKDSAKFFGKIMAERFINDFPDVVIDCVTSVPRNRKKRQDKDNTLWRFDHSERLAKCVARELSVPYKSLLIKHKSNKVQHLLSGKERFQNVKGVYKAKQNNFVNVLLIDDIKTTGATLDECSRMLMLAGTENVYCATAVISA